MDSVVSSAVSKLIEVAVLAIVSLGAFYLKGLVKTGVAYLTTKIGSEQFIHLKEFAQTIVRSIEQSPIYADFDGSKKKELAIVAITQWAEKLGLPITHDLIDKVIEEAVQIMNTEIGPVLSGEVIDAVAAPITEVKA